ncbi:MAG: TRAM domain-containing protein [Candidatus Bathyarchaeota archaeon]|nr:TRAM domain-containing protein [Candidatus Bathyarchaeota archaeon]
MPRRLPQKTRNAKRKLRRRGSKRRYRPSKPFLQKAPIWRGQQLEVVIDDIGSKGDGIARMHNYMIFVPGGKVGERVTVKIVSVGGKFAVAEKIA